MRCQILNVLASATDERAVDVVRAKEQTAFFQISCLPSLVFADAAAFALIFVHVCFVMLQFDKLSEWVEQVRRQVDQHSSIVLAAFGAK